MDAWGGVNLGKNPWWNGYNNTGSWSGDLNLAYVQGRFLKNQLRVTLGRQTIGFGNARMLQLDGGSFQAVIHKMFTLDGYVGVPTTQRFTAYGSVFSANPTIGDLAVGGRLGFAWTTWVNAGVSAAFSWARVSPPARTWLSTSSSRRSPGCTFSVTSTGASSPAITTGRWARRSPTPT